MSLKRIYPAVLLALVASASRSFAQVPLPGVPAGAGGAAASSSIPGAASGLTGLAGGGATQPTLGGFFGITKANCAACKAKLCASPLGQVLNNALAPVSAVSGGLIPQFCPTTPTAAQLAALQNSAPGSPAAVAAAIKANEADAKARVAAVEYLGTVDCNYWPEAQKALLNALRADQNECVRYAAARVLSNGCCCGKETIRRLTISVMGPGAVGPKGKTEDGEPAESSERVRCAAMVALQNCVANAPPEPAPETAPGEGPFRNPTPRPEGEGPRTGPSTSVGVVDDSLARVAFLRTLSRKPLGVVMNDARIAIEVVGRREPTMFTTGNRSLMSAIARARTTPKAQPVASQAAVGAIGLLGSPPPGAPHVHDNDLAMTPPSAPESPKADAAPAMAPNPAEPLDLPPLPTSSPAVPATTPVPRTPRFEVAPSQTNPAGEPNTPSAAQSTPSDAGQDVLPPLPASTIAPPVRVVLPAAMPATTYRPANYPPAVARVVPPQRPRPDARAVPAGGPASDSDAALYERFRRDPDSFRGDYPR